MGARVRITSPACSKPQKMKKQTNQLKGLVDELRFKGYDSKTPLLVRLAKDLSRSTRQRRVVNLSKINMHAKNGETVVVPGKVLASGELDHTVTIAAWKFSKQALDKIEKAKCKALELPELIKDGVKGKKIRMIG